MEKPVTMIFNETKDSIVRALNGSGLHPLLLSQIISEINTEVQKVLLETTMAEKKAYEESEVENGN